MTDQPRVGRPAPPDPRAKPSVPSRPTSVIPKGPPPIHNRQTVSPRSADGLHHEAGERGNARIIPRNAGDIHGHQQHHTEPKTSSSSDGIPPRGGADVHHHQGNGNPSRHGDEAYPRIPQRHIPIPDIGPAPTPKNKGTTIHIPIETIDLAKLDSTSLPICVRVQSSFGSWTTGGVKIQKGDELMLHCIEETRVVLATDTAGRSYQLPANANQLYEILPLDPRLDDKTYEGTASLVKADPLPKAVRVTEGYCAADETNTKEVDDVIYIQAVKNKVLIGRVCGEQVRYRSMDDSAEYTTMIHENKLPLSRVVQEEMPQRVRAVCGGEDNSSSEKSPGQDLVLRLESVVTRKRVLATRAVDSKLFTIPLETRISLDVMTPKTWKDLQVLVKPVYALVNTSLCQDDPSKDMLPEEWRGTMKATPRPLQTALDFWLESVEGKARVAEIAQTDSEDLQRKLSQQGEELQAIKKQLAEQEQKHDYREPPNPPIPSRPSDSPTMRRYDSEGNIGMSYDKGEIQKQLKWRHSIAAGHRGSEKKENVGVKLEKDPVLEEDSTYDTVSHQARMSQAVNSLARTDLEKLLKKLLDEKVMEQRMQTDEMNRLKKQNKVLQSELKRETRGHLALREQLETQTDESDCYDLMSPSPLKSSKAGRGQGTRQSPTDTKHASPEPPPVMNSSGARPAPSHPAPASQIPVLPARPLPSTPGTLSRSTESLGREICDSPKSPRVSPQTPPIGSMTSPKPPLLPLPELPVSALSSSSQKTGTSLPHNTGKGPKKHPHSEYAPPIIHPSSHGVPVGGPGLIKAFGKESGSQGSTFQGESTSGRRGSLPSTLGPLPPTPGSVSAPHKRGTNSYQTDSLKIKHVGSNSQGMPTLPESSPYVSPYQIVSGEPDTVIYTLPDDENGPPPPPPPPRLDASYPLPPSFQTQPDEYTMPDRFVNQYTKEEVALLLQSLGLGSCVDRFLKESVDGSLLLSIDEDIMITNLGMTSFEARRLTMKIDELTSKS